MAGIMDTLLRQRELHFKSVDQSESQAQSALLILSDIDGIERLDILHTNCLLVSYNLTIITFDHIELALQEIGFHLDNSLLYKLKRALYTYTEETIRANMGIGSSQSQTTRDVFVKHYKNRPHGCRDLRPQHWRHYR